MGSRSQQSLGLTSAKMASSSSQLLSLRGQLFILQVRLNFLRMLRGLLGWFPSSCVPGDGMVAHLWSISFCQCQAPNRPMWGALSTPRVFSELLITEESSSAPNEASFVHPPSWSFRLEWAWKPLWSRMHSGDLHYGLSPLKTFLEFPSKVNHRVFGSYTQPVPAWKLSHWKMCKSFFTATMATSSPTSSYNRLRLCSVWYGAGLGKMAVMVLG